MKNILGLLGKRGALKASLMLLLIVFVAFWLKTTVTEGFVATNKEHLLTITRTSAQNVPIPVEPAHLGKKITKVQLFKAGPNNSWVPLTSTVPIFKNNPSVSSTSTLATRMSSLLTVPSNIDDNVVKNGLYATSVNASKFNILSNTPSIGGKNAKIVFTIE